LPATCPLVMEVVLVLQDVEEIPDEDHERVTGRVCAIRCGQGVGEGVHAGAS
jgi:hypothetical protein